MEATDKPKRLSKEELKREWSGLANEEMSIAAAFHLEKIKAHIAAVEQSELAWRDYARGAPRVVDSMRPVVEAAGNAKGRDIAESLRYVSRETSAGMIDALEKAVETYQKGGDADGRKVSGDAMESSPPADTTKPAESVNADEAGIINKFGYWSPERIHNAMIDAADEAGELIHEFGSQVIGEGISFCCKHCRAVIEYRRMHEPCPDRRLKPCQ